VRFTAMGFRTSRLLFPCITSHFPLKRIINCKEATTNAANRILRNSEYCRCRGAFICN